MKRILIVDDKEENLYLLRVLLEGHGYEVQQVANGHEALLKARQRKQNMIISDVLMPVMDGFTLCRTLKADDQLKHIPLIFYTATYTDSRDERLALDMGATAFIIKPAEPDEFMRRIEEIFAANKDEKLSAPQKQPAANEVILKEYNEVLIRKLEHKMLSLEQANKALEAEIAARKQAEEALWENTALFARISSQAPGMLYQFLRKPDGTYSVPFSSDGVREIFGCSPEDVRDTFDPIFQAIFPEDRDIILQTIEESASSMMPWTCEYRVQLPGKDIRWILGNSIPEKMADGAIVWSGYNTDISERKRVETVIKESERAQAELIEKLNEAQRIALVGSWDWNLQTNQVWWSDETYRIFGVTPQNFTPSFEENGKFIHPDDFEKYNKSFELCLKTGEPLDLDSRLVTPDGRLKYCHATGQVFFDDAGQKRRFIGTIMDITVHKREEEELVQSKNFLNLIIENTPNPMWISDKDGTVIMMNEALRNLLKIRDEEIIGIYNVQKDIQVEEQGFLPLVRSVFTAGKTVEFTIEYNTGKEKQVNLQMATTMILDIIITPIIDNEGKFINAIAQHKDVTERKRAEEEILRLNEELEKKVDERTRELQNSQLALLNLVDDLNQGAKNTDLINRKLEETNKELGAFSYSVSHDLRAPLRSIDGFSLALLEDYQDKFDDTGKNYLNKIRAATQHMGLLIEDMLKLSRISHAELHHESINLSKIVQSIAETLQQSNPDDNMKMTIQEGIVITGDLNSMQIAVTNLLENAWKFTGKQKHPSIEFGMTLKEGEKVFFIRDNGVGFNMSYVNKLFGAFQRLHSTDEFPGTGIGLATVKRIITRHGGQIWAEGEIGKGATFFFTIPE